MKINYQTTIQSNLLQNVPYSSRQEVFEMKKQQQELIRSANLKATTLEWNEKDGSGGSWGADLNVVDSEMIIH